jgi:hypothetical protein
MDKYNTNRSLLSSIFPKNPYTTTGLGDRTPTNQNKSEISTITVNFAKISQDSLIFAARASLDPAQKISIITAVDRSLLDIQGGWENA